MRTVPRFLAFAAAFFLSAAVPSFAQRPPSGPAGNGPSTGPIGGGNNNNGGNQPGIGQQPGQQQNFPTQQRPIFLSGKVMLEGGMPPPEPVTIERVCNGHVWPEGYSDSKGHFSFQLGQQGNAFMDASVGMGDSQIDSNPMVGGMNSRGGAMGMNGINGGIPVSGNGQVNLMGCELRASLAGYQSQSVNLGTRSIFDNPDVGTFILHRLANAQATAISMTTLEAPKDAKRSWERAQKLMQQKPPKTAEASKELEKAVQGYPKFAAAWFMLGQSRLAQQDEDGARKAFEESLNADAKYLPPYIQLTLIEMKAGRWDSAADTSNRLVQMNPYYSRAFLFNSIANFNRGKLDLAEQSARSAMKSDGSNPTVHHLLASILSQKGSFPEAADEFRAYLKLSPQTETAGEVRKKLAEWEDLGVIKRVDAANSAPAAANGNAPVSAPQ